MTLSHYEATLRTADGVELFCQAWRPDGNPRAVLVNVHGIGDHSGLYPMLAEHFVPRGWAVHAFDLRGNGRSAGRRGHVSAWAEYREDLARFLDVVRAKENCPLFLLGNSMGGVIVLDYALRRPEGLCGVIAVAPPLGQIGVPPWLLALGRVMSRVWPTFTWSTGLDLSGISRDPAARDAIVNDPFFHRKASARLSTEFFAATEALHREAARFSPPLLLLHGGADRMVFPDGTRAFFARVGQPDKCFLEYPGAYHALFADLDRTRVLADLERWMTAHLDSV